MQEYPKSDYFRTAVRHVVVVVLVVCMFLEFCLLELIYHISIYVWCMACGRFFLHIFELVFSAFFS